MADHTHHPRSAASQKKKKSAPLLPYGDEIQSVGSAHHPSDDTIIRLMGQMTSRIKELEHERDTLHSGCVGFQAMIAYLEGHPDGTEPSEILAVEKHEFNFTIKSNLTAHNERAKKLEIVKGQVQAHVLVLQATRNALALLRVNQQILTRQVEEGKEKLKAKTEEATAEQREKEARRIAEEERKIDKQQKKIDARKEALKTPERSAIATPPRATMAPSSASSAHGVLATPPRVAVAASSASPGRHVFSTPPQTAVAVATASSTTPKPRVSAPAAATSSAPPIGKPRVSAGAAASSASPNPRVSAVAAAAYSASGQPRTFEESIAAALALVHNLPKAAATAPVAVAKKSSAVAVAKKRQGRAPSGCMADDYDGNGDEESYHTEDEVEPTDDENSSDEEFVAGHPDDYDADGNEIIKPPSKEEEEEERDAIEYEKECKNKGESDSDDDDSCPSLSSGSEFIPTHRTRSRAKEEAEELASNNNNENDNDERKE
jgi:hypothetical protein